MSYSRWSNSCWYTYSTVSTINDEPTFCVQCDDSFPLSDLIENKKGVLDKFRQERWERNPTNYRGQGEAPKDRYTEDEIQELEEYIDCFIEDHKDQKNFAGRVI